MLENKKIDLLKDILGKGREELMVCPKCGAHVTIVQLPPRYGPYGVVYDTYLECSKCNFRMKVNSYTLYGAVRDYDEKTIEISSWSDMGSREVNRFYHALDESLLKKLKESGDLVEFLIVNDVVLLVVG
ncbi:MAG TPA: hypothetical protein ENI14_02260 [Thermoplasmatales archaeon]|nr:hypothetical protein [Thermoplasmatales archaeon]